MVLVRGRELAESSNSVMKRTTYWLMKKDIAKENEDKTVQLMIDHNFVVWADNYAQNVGHVIPTADKGAWTYAANTGELYMHVLATCSYVVPHLFVECTLLAMTNANVLNVSDVYLQLWLFLCHWMRE